jgi:ABC-2 type transport system ATP-binding protein
MTAAAIACRALTRDFGNVRALDGLTLDVPAGSIFAFLGPNGAGKTTTIHLLLGIIEPTSGSSRVLGLDPVVSGDEVRRNCGALLEHSGVYERLSAEDNLRFYARIAHLPEEEAEGRIAEVLTRFGLYERRHDLAGTWSRGMKQKLAIARVLLHDPSVIFLDEPTAGLDPEATVALRKDIVSLGTTIFLTTHNLTDVEKMATHVAVIRKGQLLDYGTPAELRARAVRSHVLIRMSGREPLALDLEPGQSAAPIVTKLVHEGAQIEEVRREEASIEDVFLQLVKSGVRQRESPLSNTEAVPPPPRKREPLFRDIAAIVRKEWSEMTSSAGSGASRKSMLIAAAALLAIVGLLGALAGEIVLGPPALLTTFISFLVVMAYVADSFAGERERHTLETLLASAVPDEALFVGKVCASVGYGWFAALVLLAMLLAGANLRAPGSMYSPPVLLVAFVTAPLALLFFSIAGVMLSVRAPTVKAAQARTSVLLFGVFIPFVVLKNFLAPGWIREAARALQTQRGLLLSLGANSVLLLVLDVALIAFAMTRFRRARMI